MFAQKSQADTCSNISLHMWAHNIICVQTYVSMCHDICTRSFISFHFISFHFISKPRCSDTWAWHTGALLALCETKGSRQDFPLLQVGKQALIKVSTPDHSGCKFVHLRPPAAVQQSGAEGFDQKTHTASSHQWKAELQSFQEALTGDKSGCLKFLARRFAPTQSCLRSYSQRRAGC